MNPENIYTSQNIYSLGRTRPKQERILEQLKLDKLFFKAEGNYLFYKRNIGEQKVLDMVGGYGSLFLGHHHPELNAYAIELLKNKIPIHSQISSKEKVNDLANFISVELNDALKDGPDKEFITTFANSGAEAVEAALKHAKYHFSQKKKSVLNKIYQELHIINNYFTKNEESFLVELFDGSIFSNFSSFKKYIIEKIVNPIEELNPVLLATKKSFHGKTTGALDATYNPTFRKYFQTSKKEEEKVVFFEPNPFDVEQIISNLVFPLSVPVLNVSGKIEFKERSFSTCLGIIIEPIQGEAGVLPLTKDFVVFLRKITQEHNTPLIIDEIQTGCFRTGSLSFSTKFGIYADYYLFSKSLGGGIAKNSALVIEKKQYYEDFGMVHTSTFSDDEFSAAICLKALQISKIEATNIDYKADFIKDNLFRLKELFPEVVKEIRGEGLMWGIEFHNLNMTASYGFQMVCRTSYLNYLYCSYLLENWNIRFAPTLSNSNTLRIQPSIFITEKEMEIVTQSLISLCEIIHCRDFYKLIEHLLPEEERNLRHLKDFGREQIPFDIDENCNENVGFITHPIDEIGIKAGEESLELLRSETITQLFESVIEIAPYVITGAKTIISKNGKKVNAYFCGLPFTAEMVRNRMLNGKIEDFEIICNKVIDMLQEEYKCKVIGLGQYTSIITKNGKLVTNPEVLITTGNSYTVGIGLMAVLKEVQKYNVEEFVLGVIGAGGNICSTYIKCFVPFLSKIIFKGSDSDNGKLKTLRFARELVRYTLTLLIENTQSDQKGMLQLLKSTTVYKKVVNGDLNIQDLQLFDKLKEELGEKMPFEIVDDLYDLVQCKVTVVATNDPTPFLFSKYFASNSIVYDISVPLNSTEELIHNDKNIKVIMGGIVKLPNNESIPIKGYLLKNGEAYACISETVLLGLEETETNYSYGSLTPWQIGNINDIGNKHGFQLAESDT